MGLGIEMGAGRAAADGAGVFSVAPLVLQYDTSYSEYSSSITVLLLATVGTIVFSF